VARQDALRPPDSHSEYLYSFSTLRVGYSEYPPDSHLLCPHPVALVCLANVCFARHFPPLREYAMRTPVSEYPFQFVYLQGGGGALWRAVALSAPIACVQ
jgi:hypothetical protein